MLTFYAYFKQGTEGAAKSRRPAFWDVVGRWKFEKGSESDPNLIESNLGPSTMPGSDWARCRERRRCSRTWMSYGRSSRRWATLITWPTSTAQWASSTTSASRTFNSSPRWRWRRPVQIPTHRFIRETLHEKRVRSGRDLAAFQMATQTDTTMATARRQTLPTKNISTPLRWE